MLNIPETVKALYKRDGVGKNFRAHFPNGELPDITNENIVQESVKFQESVCSQDVFKFGLTEASVIEFETVGVANMYGMTIECSSEIDCSSLSAAEIAEIEAGTWDGEFVPLADSDLSYAFFRVPYGVFRVKSCPRDHQAMAHRRVTAYSLFGGELKMKASEAAKLSLLYTGYKEVRTSSSAYSMPYVAKEYTPNLKALVYSNFSTRSDAVLLNAGYTKTSLTLSGGYEYPIYRNTLALKTSGNTDISIVFEGYARVSDMFKADDIQDKIFGVDPVDFDYAAMLNNMASYLEDLGVDATASGYGSLLDIVKDGFQNSFLPFVAINAFTAPGRQIEDFYALNAPDYGLYLYRNYSYVQLCAPRYLVLGLPDYSETHNYYPTVASFYEYTPPAEQSLLDSMTLSFESTLQSGQKTSFANAYSINDMVQGYLELNAQLARPTRNGGIDFLALSLDEAVSIPPADYSQMWFDEFDVRPIGTVRYSYTDDAGEEQVVDYKFGEGTSVYDMTGNTALRALKSTSREAIEQILDTLFVPHLQPINYTPIDLEMKGLPYIEAGDALAVTAQDGTVCNSYALRRELSGVQVLTDQIDSESGLIIESGEGT